MMQWYRHVHRRRRKSEKEKAVDENRPGVQVGLPLVPTVDPVLGAGRVDPFNSLPVTMSSSMSKLLDCCKCSATSTAPRGYGAVHLRKCCEMSHLPSHDPIPGPDELLTRLLCYSCYNCCSSTLSSQSRSGVQPDDNNMDSSSSDRCGSLSLNALFC